MIPAINFDQSLALLRSRVDGGWFDELLSTPDGQAIVYGLLDILVAVDDRNSARAAWLRVRRAVGLSGSPALGAHYATTTLALTRVKSGRALMIPAGTVVSSPDGHTFTLDAPVSFGGGQLNAAQTVSATATSPGWLAFLPPGSIDRFVPVANGVTGVGLSITRFPGSGQPAALRFRTDITQPFAFRSTYVGLYLEVTDCPSHTGNIGRQIQIAAVNDGSSFAAAAQLESGYGWGPLLDDTVSAENTAWFASSSPFAFAWTVRDWTELGIVVTNTTTAVPGAEAILDELAVSKGRPRATSEDDEALRRRLLRAPQGPSPIGLLRKAIEALTPYGASRHDVRVYELGALPPGAVDLYAENFPAAAGFVADMHCSDMTTPFTPDGMASKDPSYATLSPFVNPGLALLLPLSQFAATVDWTPPAGMSGGMVAVARRSLFAASDRARQPGCLLQIYNQQQWGYP